MSSALSRYSAREVAVPVYRRLGLNAETIEPLRRPYRELHVEVPARMDDGRLEVLSGFRVQHSGARGPYKGGVRFHAKGRNGSQGRSPYPKRPAGRDSRP